MDAGHASLDCRTLDEIRQKRAAERLSKASSGPDLNKITSANGLMLLESESPRAERGYHSGLVSQLKDMQKRNLELEEENRLLTSKLQTTEVENDILQKRLNAVVEEYESQDNTI